MWVENLQLDKNGLPLSITPDRQPQLLIVFGQTDAFLPDGLYSALKGAFPDACLIGCSSGTYLQGQDLHDEGLAVTMVGFERTPLKLAATALHEHADCRAVGRALGRALAADDLVGVFVLSDGLQVNGSDLVAGLADTVAAQVKISGGLAGDGARFGQTKVLADGVAQSGVVTALGFYGPAIRIAHGSAGGWDEFGPMRKISRAQGNVLYELDGKPALELYERYLGEEAADLPASALLYPLKIWDPEHPDHEVVRTVLAIDRETGSMTFAGDVPEGWQARLMRGQFDRLVDGAESATRHALDQLREESSGLTSAITPAISPALCLFVSCVGRRLLMGQRTDDEVLAIADVLGHETALAGFYSYGEIAPHNVSQSCGLHNQTVTLTLLAEVL